MKSQSWEHDTYRYVTINKSAHVLSWSDTRRGCEWGEDQSQSDFLAKGPPGAVDVLPRSVVLEMLAFMGVEKTPWFDPSKTIEISVLGTPTLFYADPSLRIHDESTRAIVDKYGLTLEEYYRKYPLKSGVLARNARIGSLVFAEDTELMLYVSGAVMIGVLADEAHIDGRVCAARARVVFREDGSLEMVNG